MFQLSSNSQTIFYLGPCSQARLKAPCLKCLLFILFWEKRDKGQSVEARKRLLPHKYFHVSWMLISSAVLLTTGTLHKRKHQTLPWVGPTHVMHPGPYLCFFIYSQTYGRAPTLIIGLCSKLGKRWGKKRYLCCLSVYAKEKWECSRNSLWHNLS